MKKLSPLFAACLLGFCAVASATTYECTDRQGRRTYTATPGPNCHAANLGRVTTYPAPVSTAPSYPSYNSPATPEPAAPAAQPTVNESQRQAANERLRQAERNLEEGRKVRYGNERNYAKYLERISGLENAVKQAETELNNLSK